MNQPWYLVGFGVLVSALGGLFVGLGLASTPTTTGLFVAGCGVGGLGGLMLFVGLIGLGVEIGVRGSQR